MNLQAALAIVEETELSEAIHEKTHSRPGGTDHLRQGLLTDFRNYSHRSHVSRFKYNPPEISHL